MYSTDISIYSRTSLVRTRSIFRIRRTNSSTESGPYNGYSMGISPDKAKNFTVYWCSYERGSTVYRHACKDLIHVLIEINIVYSIS